MSSVVASGDVLNVVGQDIQPATDTNNPNITWFSGYGSRPGQLGLVFTGSTRPAELRSTGGIWFAKIGSIKVVETDDLSTQAPGVAWFGAGEGTLQNKRPQDRQFDVKASLTVNGETQSHIFDVTPTIVVGRLRDTAGGNNTTPDSVFSADSSTIDFFISASPSFNLTYNNGAIVKVNLQTGFTTDINQTGSIIAKYEIVKDASYKTYNGSSTSESLNNANWDYGWNKFFMKGGNDKVAAPSDVEYALYFNGGIGNDYFRGGDGVDRVFGGVGNDGLNGDDGGDDLYGQSDRDALNGAAGNDNLYGGTGRDTLTGGDGFDVFVFKKGESRSEKLGADDITDWNDNFDSIDLPIAGTNKNFGHLASSAKNIEDAKLQAEKGSLANKTYFFLHNPNTDKGYLLADLDNNNSFETGIVIKGAGKSADLHYYDIV